MDNSKHTQLKIAKKLWELYQDVMDKSTIAKTLNINRAEVTHVIKYTTSTQYLNNVESQNFLRSCINEKEKLTEQLNFWKFSNLDAYSNNEKNGHKLTYKRLVEIRESKIDELNKTISENKFRYLNFKKWYWIFFLLILFITFLTGAYVKGYFMKQQNYHQVDTSTTWENEEGDTLYKLVKQR